MPKRLSFQLYCARKFPPLENTLALLAETGYREVEGYGGVYDDPAGLRKLLDVNGLTMPSGHFSVDMLEKERGKARDIATTLGMRHIYAPYLVAEQRPKSAAGWKSFGKRLAAIGEWVRSEGFGFGWHNHDFEFVKLPSGEAPHELIFAAAPMLDWECDAAWIVRAKASPLTWIKRYADRITAVHVKDIAPKGQCVDEDGWADLGKGTVKWPDIFKALKASRTLHYVLEHDNPSDLKRFAARSFAYVSKI
jgi:sugar phosphate isomerase/epimerase